MKERAVQLHKHLYGEAEVRSFVFCPNDPIESDYKRASEHGITLVGKKELAELIGMLAGAVDDHATMKALDGFRSSQLGGMFRSPGR